jgi:hypothetical protein
MKDIHIPPILYKYMPWFCIGLAVLALALPSYVVAPICSAYLFFYGTWVLFKRLQ